MKKSLLVGIVFFVFVSFVFAITGEVTSFDSQTNPFNITFNGNENHTYYLDIPRYAFVENVSLRLEEYEITNWCYQESANDSTVISSEGVLNGDCGLVYNGSYAETITSGSGFFWMDGDYGTYSYSGFPNYYYINYTKPVLAVGAKLRYKVGNSFSSTETLNTTLSNTEFNYIDGKVVLRWETKNLGMDNWIKGYIWDGATWNQYYSRTTGAWERLYDESIYWNISNIANPYLEIGTPDSNYEWNYSGVFNISETISLNTTLINNILSNGCTCTGCSIVGDNCRMPYLFHSDTTGILEVNLTLGEYTLPYIDNCTDSNSTTINVSFIDIDTNLPINASSTISLEGDYSYSKSYVNVSNYALCIYPSWGNVSELLSIQYDRGGASSYYNSEVTLSNNTLYLNLSLESANTETTTFTIKNELTSATIQDVYGTMYRKVAGDWVVVSAKYSDITGRMQFDFTPNTEYKFYLAKSGYEDYIFYLNPIIFDSYDVLMQQSLIVNTTQDYDRVAIYYTPTRFYEDDLTTFTFLIQSPYSELNSYGFNITYPGGYKELSGYAAVGESLETSFTIVNATISDQVELNYYYETDLAGLRTFTQYYSIAITAGNYTVARVKDNTYGMGLFERLFIAVLMCIIVAGIGALVGKPIAGSGLALLIYCWLAIIEFIPVWSIAISVLVGVIIIGSRGGD